MKRVVAWLAASLFACTQLPATVGARSPASLQVGSIVLHRCESAAPWCGTLLRPLDPTGVIAGNIAIYFEFFPHTQPGDSQGTLVATEGGPGFPATESRDEYLDLFGPLRGTRDVVLMDNRGTGRSGAIDCHPLQTDPTITESNVAQCGRALGSKAALYSVTLAADDLAAILGALGSGPVDLYGDSYGTFFEQMFAVRHPDRLRSIVLDGAYPLAGRDYAWYPSYAPAMRTKFNLACERSPECARLPGSSLDRITKVLESLRRAPVVAQARDGDGRLRSLKADPALLATVMFGSAPAYASVRELDASARAYIGGDRAPLFRLMAETQVQVDSRDETRSARKFSSGLAVAVMCQDAPQVFDMTLDPVRRVKSRDAAIAERQRTAADTYAPFTVDEYRGMPLDYAFIDECVRWNAISPAQVQSMAALRESAYPDIPALIISGDLDNMTPVADGALVAKRFPGGRQIVVPNGFHVNALRHARSACPARIAQAFIATLKVTDTQCLKSIPEVRLLPKFVRQVEELSPASAVAENEATSAELRVVSGAVFTVADAIARLDSNSTGKGVGLRGGTFDSVARRGATEITLREMRWADDLSVTGTISKPARDGKGSARVTVAGPAGVSGTLQIEWNDSEANARAHVHGSLGTHLVVAETGAP